MDFSFSKEQRDIIRAAKEFAEGEFPAVAEEFDRTETFDQEIWRQAAELGFLAVFVNEEYGGAGLGFMEHCLINEEFWAVDPGLGQAVMSTTFGAEMIQIFDTEERKQELLPRLVEGEAILATAITEPGAGSDVTQVATTAELRDGEWIINGAKIFITNGTLADYVLLFCQTDPDAERVHDRFSFLLVETDRPGFEATKIKGKLGVRASDTAELAFSEMRVPESALVGIRGNGFPQLMALFNRSRLHICAQAVGLTRACLEDSIRHTKGRVQFGAPLAAHQATQFKLAEMYAHMKAGKNLYLEAAWLMDQGKVDHGLIASAKWFCGQMAVRAADEAVQMHGGYGYIDEYRVQRLYRDCKILEIYEGAKEVEKTIAARQLLR